MKQKVENSDPPVTFTRLDQKYSTRTLDLYWRFARVKLFIVACGVAAAIVYIITQPGLSDTVPLIIVGAFMLGTVTAFIPLTVTCVKVVRSARRDKARRRAGLPLNDLPLGNNGHQDEVR